MELDDLKNTWNETKSRMPEQQTLHPEILAKRRDQNYRAKVKKIMLPEIAGSIVCLAAAAFIGYSFTKLDTNLLRAIGVLSILLLLALPVISALSTWKLGQVGNVNSPYAETLKLFALQKIRFIKLQKLNVTLCYLLLVTIIVLLSRLLAGTNLSNNRYYWLFSFTIGFIFLSFFSRWVEKFYSKSLRQAEELLKETLA